MDTFYYREHDNWYTTQTSEYVVAPVDVIVVIKLMPNGSGIIFHGTRADLEDELKLRKYSPIDVLSKEEMLLIALRATSVVAPARKPPRPRRFPAY